MDIPGIRHCASSLFLAACAVYLSSGPGATIAAEPDMVPINDNDLHPGGELLYSRGWTLWTGPAPREGTLHYANQAGSSVQLTFHGTRVALLHKVGPDCGIAQITIDDRPAAVGLLDTYGPTVEWNHRTLLAQDLPPGAHTLRIEVTGRRHERSSDAYLQVVGFDLDDPDWRVRQSQVLLKQREEEAQRLIELRGRVPKLAFVKRHHFRNPGAGGVLLCWDVFTSGGGIYTFDPTRPEDGEREIFNSDRGVVFDMTPSFDAERLLFSWMDLSSPGEDSFHVYEINVDGSGLRQLTTGRYHDVSPAELPDGGIAFVSTRVESFSMCQDAPASALHVMRPDGSDIRRIQFGTLADFSPYVLDDGSILFTRWEYQDKSVFSVQSLWTINPDGARLNLFYGNTITIPNTIWQAKPIPGTNRVICTLAPHHRNLVGAIGILDRRQGLENPRSLVNITPEIPYQPTNDPRWQPGDALHYWSYRDPWPIDRDLYLVAYGGGGPERYRLYLLQEDGRKTPLWEDTRISCFNPVPLVPRRRPHLVSQHEPTPPAAEPTTLPGATEAPAIGQAGHGTFLVVDVYQGLPMIERGTVKELRVMTQVRKPTNNRGARAYFNYHDIVDPVIGAGTFYVKYNCGTVPVEADGSAYFRAPAGTELYFQALDADGKELSRMGSFTQLMPGEHQSCVGCHEPRFSAPPRDGGVPMALENGPVDITPPPWGAGPVDFVRQVQPVLDEYCADCHGGVDPAAGIDLSGDKTRHFNMAYENLAVRNLVDFLYLTPPQEETGHFRPLTTGSRVSRIVELIEQGHGDVDVDDQGRRKLYTWIEANIPYYATYQHTRPGTAGSRDAWSGEWTKPLADRFGARCAACHGELEFRQDTPHSAWVNLTRPQFSRILNGPLATSAGGLGLCRQQDGQPPALFADKNDPDYRAMLAAIVEGRRQLGLKPRMDMPNAVPAEYERDFGRLFRGGGR